MPITEKPDSWNPPRIRRPKGLTPEAEDDWVDQVMGDIEMERRAPAVSRTTVGRVRR